MGVRFSRMVCALRVAASLLWPRLLPWDEFLPVVAVCRGAVGTLQWQRACMVFDIEKRLRLRTAWVKSKLGMAPALNCWSIALHVWRAFANRDLTGLREAEFAPVLVDALLSFAAATSSMVRRAEGFRVELRREHAAPDRVKVFDQIMRVLLYEAPFSCESS